MLKAMLNEIPRFTPERRSTPTLMPNAPNKIPAVGEYRNNLLMTLALDAVTFALFAPAIRFQFLNYDDDHYVYDNLHVMGGLNLDGLRYAFTTIDEGNW